MDTPLSSQARCKRIHVDNSIDIISKLPDDLLIKILKRLTTTQEVVKTSVLSKRWSGVWKRFPYLVFDMQRIFLNCDEPLNINSIYLTKLMKTKETRLNRGKPLNIKSYRVAKLITKVINNHNGHLVLCIIHHFSYQIQDGTLESWIQTLIHEKQVKCLQLKNLKGPCNGIMMLRLPPNTFSHPPLESLFLYQYEFDKAHAFNNCHNLKVLKLERIFANFDVFNKIIASCSSLKVLMLENVWYNERGCLKIHNDNLKLLHLSCNYVSSIEVNAPLLDIFSVSYMYDKRTHFVMKVPRLLNPKLWDHQDNMTHTIIYNISYNAQEKENLGHEFVVSRYSDYLWRFNSLMVTIDLMNPREVQMLIEVLVAWTGIISHLEILFKEKEEVGDEEARSSNGGGQRNTWEKIKMFPIDDFCVKVVTLLNFNGFDEEQFAFASLFITQGIVMETMRIKTSSVHADEKLVMEIAVANLMKLRKGNEMLRIECY